MMEGLGDISVREFINVSPVPLDRRIRLSFGLFSPLFFFIPAICINIHRPWNRLNGYTPVSRRNVAPWIPAVNFNRGNMLAFFVRGPDARRQDNPPKRTNSFRSASSKRRETTRHNARLWLEVGFLFSFPLLSPSHSLSLFLSSHPPSPLLSVPVRASADSHRCTSSFYLMTPHELGNYTLKFRIHIRDHSILSADSLKKLKQFFATVQILIGPRS